MNLRFIVLVFVVFMNSCAQKSQMSEKDSSVKVNSAFLKGSNKVETLYSKHEGNCRSAWQTIAEKQGDELKVQLINRSHCNDNFDVSKFLHKRVLSKIVQDYQPSMIKVVQTGGVQSLEPDGRLNKIIAEESNRHPEYLDYRKNYPKHRSKKSSNAILVEILKKTQVLTPFKTLMEEVGLFLELESVEKVNINKNEQGQTVLTDAATFWWVPNKNQTIQR